MNRIIALLASLLFTCSLIAQLSGTIKNTDGEKMAYASVYVMGSSIGTTTNMEGYYDLKLSPGQYKIIFQYVGFESVTKDVNIGQERLVLNITLDVQSLLLDEIIIAADSEDPAYRVIRKAIEKRAYYNNLVNSYSCDVYVKGNNKILKAPERIMGVEVGDLEGLLDSSRQGIVYLSESVSELHFRQPNDYKEIVTSSKVSGNDRGYSFNSAKEMDFNIYSNSVELNRAIVSPIANNALRYYDYRLEGTYYDGEERLINQIAVIPKRSSDPTFYGHIYIVEDLWLVHSFSLSVTGKSSQLYFIDTLTFDQIFIPIEDPDVWRLFNNTISFKFSGFGFVMAGKFTAIYNNYIFNPVFDNDFFNSITHKVEKESNKRDSAYWESVRPVPLTIEEIKDYSVKDSLFQIKDSEVYKDSIDRKRNKVNVGIVLGGYSHQSSVKHEYWNISSPLSGTSFNTVQGINSHIDIGWRKYFDTEETKRLLLNGTIDYGFSERKLRGFGNVTYRPNRTSSTQLSIYGGSRIQQFNSQEPISRGLNTIYSLLMERNYAKYYAKEYLGASYRTDLSTGVILNTSLSWENRSALSNNSDWVIRNRKNTEYTSNNPLDPTDNTPFFDNHQALLVGLSTTIRIGQKYVLFPDRRFSDDYHGPLIGINYKGAFKSLGGDVNFHHFDANISQTIDMGVSGQLEYFVNGGTFFNDEGMEFVDYQHFMGNEILFTNKSELGQRFFLLSYYNKSTADDYLQVHLQHHFNGFLLDKVPGINNLGFSLVAGAKYLHVGDKSNYAEIHIGLDKIGWHFFRAFRIDAVVAFENRTARWGTRIGMGF